MSGQGSGWLASTRRHDEGPRQVAKTRCLLKFGARRNSLKRKFWRLQQKYHATLKHIAPHKLAPLAAMKSKVSTCQLDTERVLRKAWRGARNLEPLVAAGPKKGGRETDPKMGPHVGVNSEAGTKKRTPFFIQVGRVFIFGPPPTRVWHPRVDQLLAHPSAWRQAGPAPQRGGDFSQKNTRM